MSARPLTRTPRGRRALMAGGLALSIALVPGTAWAEDEPTTPTPEDAVTEVVEDVQDGGEGLGSQDGGGELQEQEPTEETPEEPPPFEIPPEVIAGLEQFAEQAGFSQECVTGVTESLELIGNGIAGLPAELEELGTGLAAAAQQSLEEQDPAALEEFLSGLAPAPPAEGSEEPPAPPVGADITAGLALLAETLSEKCQPAPPAPEPEPTDNPQPVGNPHHPQGPAAPAPQAPQPPVQQVTYPGYAPTGAEEADGGLSPAATGLALMVLAGGLVWTGRRWRAAHR